MQLSYYVYMFVFSKKLYMYYLDALKMEQNISCLLVVLWKYSPANIFTGLSTSYYVIKTLSCHVQIWIPGPNDVSIK